MDHCKDCKHWARDDARSGTCLREGGGDDPLFWVGEYAELHTSPDFGCIQFEPAAAGEVMG
jgi:hypothetical protein